MRNRTLCGICHVRPADVILKDGITGGMEIPVCEICSDKLDKGIPFLSTAKDVVERRTEGLPIAPANITEGEDTVISIGDVVYSPNSNFVPYTCFLKTDNKKEFTVSKDFLLMSINMQAEGNIATASYAAALGNISVGGFNISSASFDPEIFSPGVDYAYKLPVPYFISQGTKISLSGFSGLSDNWITLHGYYVKNYKGMKLRPHILYVASNLTSAVVNNIPVSIEQELGDFIVTKIHVIQRTESAPNYTLTTALASMTNFKINMDWANDTVLAPETALVERVVGSRDNPRIFEYPMIIPAGTSAIIKLASTNTGSHDYYLIAVLGGYYSK